MSTQPQFLDYKQEIFKLKPVLENLKVTEKIFNKILHTLSFNRFEEYTSIRVPNMKQEQEELAAFLNSLPSFKKFPVAVLHSPHKNIGTDFEYFLYNGNHTPVANHSHLAPYFSFLNNNSEILYRDTDNLVVYPIIEALIFSNNDVIKHAMVNHYSLDFIGLSFSSTKTLFKGLSDQEIENKIRTNLTQLNSYFSQFLQTNPTYLSDRTFVVDAKKEDSQYPFFTDNFYVRLHMQQLIQYLPELPNYLSYFYLPRKIDAATIPVAKEYIQKIAEFNDKSLALTQSQPVLNQNYTERLLDIIFNHMWIINKHQEATLKEQSNEGNDFHDFIVDTLPTRAKKKKLTAKNITFPILSSGFNNELIIEIECNLKEFTDKTGITKEMIKYYLRDAAAEESRPFPPVKGENIFLLESKGTLKFGINYSYSEQQTFDNKKDLTDFYALLVFEKLINVLEEYQNRAVNNSFLRMDDLLLQIDLHQLHSELRSKKILDSFSLIQKDDVKRVKSKI